MSSFIWGMIAFPTQRNSQVTGREAETPPVFIPLKQCFAYCFAHWRSPGVCILPSSFWSITLKCLDADQSTIPNMKGDILSFHMRHRSMICSKRLQRNSIRIPIEESYLVCCRSVQNELPTSFTVLPVEPQIQKEPTMTSENRGSGRTVKPRKHYPVPDQVVRSRQLDLSNRYYTVLYSLSNINQTAVEFKSEGQLASEGIDKSLMWMSWYHGVRTVH